MMSPLAPGRYLDSIAVDGAEIGRLCRLHPAQTVPSCPDWTGADLLAHLTGFTRWLRGLYDGKGDIAAPVPVIDPGACTLEWDRTLEELLSLLRGTDPQAAVPNWSIGPQTAKFWLRRCAQDVAIHRWDAARLISRSPDPVPADIALDGVDEYLHVFIGTALAGGATPEAEATIVLEMTDLDRHVRRDLPRPGPVTTLRGAASDLLLGLWHRRDPLGLFVSGDRELVAAWPRI
ncbi:MULTISPECIES: maleylpyruvate isomerase family mycothiol-dependent enzyme [unclassified Saccharopolyspora]|uniref:maleylpyruvate isomerase family mycothiol-dependent enzyme n=1 Tax=Saccharopolyspora TaxID=1835 RepID=UPI001F17465A|nr:maleylpyruvate isomerase family mycothiol-dependent enzyme [Saccharopolyspora sp. HNM0986]